MFVYFYHNIWEWLNQEKGFQPLLLAKGLEMNKPILAGLKNFSRPARVKEPIRVIVRDEAAEAGPN